MAEAEEITGSVTRLNCQKPTFCAGRVRVGGRDVSFSVRGYCSEGDTVTLRGVWQDDPKWGRQFKGSELIPSLPADPAGLVRWLNWNARGVGAVTAQRLVDEFGIELMGKCASDPQAVAIYGKIALEEVELMAEAWKKEGHKIAAMTWLAGLGLTQKQSENVYKKWGSGAASLVQGDPYELIGNVEGFGWAVTDGVAANLKITGEDPRRLRGAVHAAVRDCYDKGGTCENIDVACRKAADLVAVKDVDKLKQVIDDAAGAGKVAVICGADSERDHITTSFALRHETFLWKFFQRAAEPGPHLGANDADEVAENYRQFSGLTHDDTQVAAIANALRYRVSVITGGAGSGKTSVSKAIVKMFTDGDVPVHLCAPTGKAARRMREVIGHQASTIHRLLEYHGGEGLFHRGPDDPFTDCVILVDEVSMVSTDLAYSLLRAVGRGCSVVLVGDPNQLPPVGPGSMLRDVLVHDLVPTTKLEKCHRQAGPLKVNSAAILSGKVEGSVPAEGGVPAPPWVVQSTVASGPELKKILKLIYTDRLAKWGYDHLSEVQCMTAKHDGDFGTKEINLYLQHLHQNSLGNPVPEPVTGDRDNKPRIYVGDRVIQTKNDYDLNVMNGEIGTVARLAMTREELLKWLGRDRSDPFGENEPDEVEEYSGANLALSKKDAGPKPVVDMIVEFTDRTLVYPAGTAGDVHLAYCLSVHKMQGSQVLCAVVIVPHAHQFMQSRSWLYTGVTRAQRTCVIIGDQRGISRAAEKIEIDQRKTILDVFARHEETRPA
jgi:exodeoxyribonuclease V alpha subunit